MAKKTDRYDLLLLDKQDKPVYLIAMLFDCETDKAVMRVIYDKQCYSHYGYHFCIHGYPDDPEWEKFPTVFMDDYEMDLLNNHTEFFLAGLLHEYGHFITRDKSRTMDADEQKDNRVQAILAGEVAPEELMADQFAAEHVGKSTMMAYLDYMIRRRRLRNDPAADLAIKEFENRKRKIKAMR